VCAVDNLDVEGIGGKPERYEHQIRLAKSTANDTGQPDSGSLGVLGVAEYSLPSNQIGVVDLSGTASPTNTYCKAFSRKGALGLRTAKVNAADVEEDRTLEDEADELNQSMKREGRPGAVVETGEEVELELELELETVVYENVDHP
jgi:hypothetical protein